MQDVDSKHFIRHKVNRRVRVNFNPNIFIAYFTFYFNLLFLGAATFSSPFSRYLHRNGPSQRNINNSEIIIYFFVQFQKENFQIV